MKAYNTPKDELLIKSDEGEELVKITPEKTTIANLEGGGGGGGSVYPEIKIKFTTVAISQVEVPAHSILRISNGTDVSYAFLVTRESFILPENGEVNCTTDLIFLGSQPFDLSIIKVEADFTENLREVIQAITGAIEIEPEPGVSVYFLYDKTEISVALSSK